MRRPSGRVRAPAMCRRPTRSWRGRPRAPRSRARAPLERDRIDLRDRVEVPPRRLPAGEGIGAKPPRHAIEADHGQFGGRGARQRVIGAVGEEVDVAVVADSHPAQPTNALLKGILSVPGMKRLAATSALRRSSTIAPAAIAFSNDGAEMCDGAGRWPGAPVPRD